MFLAVLLYFCINKYSDDNAVQSDSFTESNEDKRFTECFRIFACSADSSRSSSRNSNTTADTGKANNQDVYKRQRKREGKYQTLS